MLEACNCFEIKRIRIPRFGTDSDSSPFLPPEVQYPDIRALQIGPSSDWDQCVVIPAAGDFKKNGILVGVRQPWVGPIDTDKFRIVPAMRVTTTARDSPNIRNSELDLLVYLKGHPASFPTQRPMMRSSYFRAVVVAEDVYFNVRGRRNVAVSYNVSTAAASGVTVLVQGIKFAPLSDGSFAEPEYPSDPQIGVQEFRTTEDTNAVGAGVTSTRTVVVNGLHDFIVVNTNTLSGTVTNLMIAVHALD